MSDTTEHTAGEKLGETKGDVLRTMLMQAAIVKLLQAGVDAGGVEGSGVAYADIVEKLREELARAEEELARSPKSDLVMGEVMVLNKLLAHFSDAPAHFEKKAAKRFDDLRAYMDRLDVPKTFSDHLRPRKRGE